MSPNWTLEQKNAIYAQDGSLLVSAAAGSGKTAVLVQRVIDRITNKDNPVSVDRLLVVTYTKAAAGEMKERISQKLNELIAQRPSNVAYLKSQRLLLGRANISTVHSFCSNLIREYFFELGVSSDFKIADENTLNILRGDALAETLEQMYAENTESFNALTDCFNSSRDDKALQGILLKLYSFLRAHPFPDEWMKSRLDMYSPNIELNDTAWCKYLLSYAKDAVEYCIDVCMRAEEICRENELLNFTRSKPNGRDEKKTAALKSIPILEMLENYSSFLSALTEDISGGSWQKVYMRINNFEKGRLYTPKDCADNTDLIDAKMSRDTVCSVLDDLKAVFIQDADACSADIKKAYPVVSELFRGVKIFDEKFSALKSDKNLLDFNDLEHLTLQLLIKNDNGTVTLTDISKAVAERFDEVMVDEYQDANEVQDTIFRAVSNNEKRLFTVGDVKQSIYRFRQACPEIFLRRCAEYPLYDAQKNEYPAKIILDKNFRSREQVIDAVNFVFRLLMSKAVGEMEYTEQDELKAGAIYPQSDNCSVEYKLINTGETQDDSIVCEAKVIAEYIQKYISEDFVTEKDGTRRKPTYSDFCILMRNTKTYGAVMAKELEAYGIPASSSVKSGFLSCREISIIMSLLRAIDNPLLDIPLMATMMSPLYSFSADEMALIRAATPKGNLYTAVSNYAQNDEHTKAFLSDLNRFRNLSVAESVGKLINTIYESTSLTALVGCMKNGKSRVKNLKLLRQYASEYEQNNMKGLNAFIRYIDRMSESGIELASASGEKASANSVQIMSIHSSKGLEYPVCFIANLAKPFNSDKSDNVVISPDLGLGFLQNTNVPGCRYSTIIRNAVSKRIAIGEKSEELRVLYVAMTRAREKLVLIQSEKDVERYLTKTAQKIMWTSIPSYTVGNANSMGDWLCMCALMNRGSVSIRKQCGLSTCTKFASGLPWSIELINPEETDNNEIHERAERTIVPVDKSVLNALERRFNAKYSYAELTNLPVKFSVSELAKAEYETFMPESRPEFMSAYNLTAAQKGTALHEFLEFADFKNISSNSQAELNRLVSNGFLTSEQGRAVDLNKVNAFISNDIFQRMICSDKIYREFKFTIFVNANEISENISVSIPDEKVVLQGAVDCAFEENGKIVIIDYKTDRVNDEKELIERYKNQLYMYKNAIEQCTGKAVFEMYVYSFALSHEILIL